MNPPTWKQVRRLFQFEWDGEYPDLIVASTTLSDCDRFLKALPKWGHSLEFFEGHTPHPTPTEATEKLLFWGPDDDPPLLKIYVGKLQLNCRFWEDEITADLDPREFQGPTELDGFLGFMKNLGDVTGKKARLDVEPDVLEYDPTTPTWHWEVADGEPPTDWTPA